MRGCVCPGCLGGRGFCGFGWGLGGVDGIGLEVCWRAPVIFDSGDFGITCSKDY